MRKGDKGRTRRVRIESIALDESVQTRVGTDRAVVNEYAAILEETGDWPFPDVELFEDDDGEVYYVGDGFHRIEGAIAAGWLDVPALVRPGGEEAAFERALGANADHGLRRTMDDRRHAIELAFERWPDYSARAVAELVGVDHKTAQRWRPEGLGSQVRGRDGKMYPAGAEGDGAETGGGGDGLGDGEQEEGFAPASVPRSYDAAWVPVADRPGSGELQPWVEMPPPAWRELMEGSGIATEEMDLGALGGVAEAVRREDVVAYCREAIGNVCPACRGRGAVGEDEARCEACEGTGNESRRDERTGELVVERRWDGFRPRPISPEHAERERERWRRGERRAEHVEWLRAMVARVEAAAAADQDRAVVRAMDAVIARQAMVHAPTEALDYAGMCFHEERDEYITRLRNYEGNLLDAIVILVGFQLFKEGVPGVRGHALGPLDALLGLESVA